MPERLTPGADNVLVREDLYRECRTKVRSGHKAPSAPSGSYQPIPKAMCSACPVVMVELWLLLSSYEKPYASPPTEC